MWASVVLTIQAPLGIRGKFVLLLNTDAFKRKDTLSKTIDFMAANANCGILGVKLVGEDGTRQTVSPLLFSTPWNEFFVSTGFRRFFLGRYLVDDMSWDHSSVRECDWVPGCYYLMRRELVDQIGLFDSRYFLYFEEVDHCKAARNAGWSVMFYPFTTVVHIGGESAKVKQIPITNRPANFWTRDRKCCCFSASTTACAVFSRCSFCQRPNSFFCCQGYSAPTR